MPSPLEPGLIAALDQFRASLHDVARILGRYRCDLIAAGVPAEDALELVADLQHAVIFGTGDGG